MKNYSILLLLVFLAAFIFVSCSRTEENAEIPPVALEDPETPEIDDIEDTEAPATVEIPRRPEDALAEADRKPEETQPIMTQSRISRVQRDTSPLARRVSQDGPPVNKLSGFTNETIRGARVTYTDYILFVAPFYPSNAKNINKLKHMSWVHQDGGKDINFAVFGKLEDVRIRHYITDSASRMSQRLNEWDLGLVENSIVHMSSHLPTEHDSYKITGRVYVGNGYYNDVNFTLNTSSDKSDFELIGIY